MPDPFPSQTAAGAVSLPAAARCSVLKSMNTVGKAIPITALLESQKKVFVGALATAVGLIGGKGLEYLNRVLVARFFSPELFGLYSLAVAILNLGIVMSTAGFNTAVPRFVARYSAMGEEDKSSGVLVFSLLFLLPVSGLVAGVLYLGADWLSVNLFSEPALVNLLQTAAPIFPLGAWLMVATGYFQGRGEFLLSALYRRAVPRAFFFLALVSLYAARHLTMPGVIAAMGTGYLLAVGASLLQIGRTRLPRVRPRWNGGELLRYSWPLALTMVFTQLAHRCDLFIMAYYLQSAQLGRFNACYTLAALLLLPQALVNKAVLPVMSELIGKNDFSSLKVLYESIVNGLAVFSIPALFILVRFSKGLIEWMFGGAYVFEAMPWIIGILAAGNLVGLLAGPNGMLLASLGHTRTQMGIGICSAALGIGVALLLIGPFELLGAATAAAIYVVVSNGSGIYFIRKHVPVHILSSRMVKIVSCGVVAIPLSTGGAVLFEEIGSGLWTPVVEAVLFIGFYFFMLRCMGVLSLEDVRRYKEMWNERSRRRTQ